MQTGNSYSFTIVSMEYSFEEFNIENHSVSLMTVLPITAYTVVFFLVFAAKHNRTNFRWRVALFLLFIFCVLLFVIPYGKALSFTLTVYFIRIPFTTFTQSAITSKTHCIIEYSSVGSYCMHVESKLSCFA